MTTSFPHDTATREDIQVFPASFAQQRLWFLGQSEPDSAAYSLPVTIGLRGLLDVSVLERSLNAIVQRHEALRTTFRMMDGQPVQVIASTLIVSLPVVDLRDLPEAERDAQVLQLVTEAAYEPFNLAQGPLVRATLLRLNEEEHVLLLTAHPMVFDDWSTHVFIRELAVLYESFSVGRPSSLPDLPIQYADYACRQRESVQSDVLAAQLSYWKQQLSGAPAILPLPTDRPRPGVQTFEGAQQSLALPKTLTEALQTLSRQEGVTLFMILLAAFHILLQRYTGQEDLVIGSSIANRTQKEVEGLIGCFANTLALRSNLSGNPSFRELLVRVREVSLEAYAHTDIPFEQLVEELQPERNLNRLPAFDVMINFINTPSTIWELPGLTISSIQIAEPAAKFAMTLYVEAGESDLRLRLVYQRLLFSPDRIACILDQFQYLLEQIVAAPEKPIQLYSLVTPKSVHVLPNPRTVLLEPQYELITHMFASWASRAPEQPAVCQNNRTRTYQELAESAYAIARFLLTQGHKPGDVVAILGQQSFGLIASMMAVLLAGGVLLPIDGNLPAHRQQLMLREAGAKHLLYIVNRGNWRPEDKWVQELPSPAILCVEPDTGRVVEPKSTLDVEAAQLPALSPNDAAYIFFTSGTTGTPNGVLGCHKGLSHFLNWQRETFAVGPHDRCTQLTGLSFDVVLRDVFLPLTGGATLCLPEWSDEPGLDQVLLWLEREKISLLHTVPALAQSWLANLPSGVSLRSLRWVFFAGEPLTDVLVQRWRAAFPEAGGIANFYGPTETSLAKCSYLVDSDTAPGIQPVGWPLPETQALVLTESNQLCGIGELDEMAPSLLPTIEAVSRESYRRPVSALIVGKEEEGANEVVVVPTSLQQQGLWLVDQLESNRSAYNLPIMLRLRKRLDMSALEQSLQALVQRHETLRTTFVLIDEQPMQVIAPGMRMSLTAVDLRALSHEQQEVEVQQLVSHEVQQPFDLAHGPLLRAMVLHLGAEEHLVLLVMHHIISDGWSVGVIGQELAQLYDAYVTGSPAQLAQLPLQYADFALWQREWLQEERLDEQLTYWKETLAGAPPVLELPTDHPRPALPTHHGAAYSFTLSQTLSEGLKHLSRREGVTLYMTLVAAFVALLGRYTGQDDVVIGTTTAGRSQQETKDLIGYFVNTLVLRTDVGGNPSVREVLARVREAVFGMHTHQEVPFERLVKELQPERSLSQHPIFQALLTLDPPLPELASAWEFVQMSTRTVANKFDLVLSLSDRGEGVAGCVEYSTDLFEDATIVRMMKHWQTLLEAMIADPEQPIAHLSLLTERERQQLLVEWNATQQSAPDKCFPQLFEEQVLRTPDAIALVFEHQQVNYRELNRKANQLAHYLQGMGVGPDVMVGLCVERSPEMIIGLLGILKAGGVYVPLDPEYPQERLTFLLRDTQMPVLLTQHRLLSRLPHQHVQLVCLDTDWGTIAQHSEANPISVVKGEHLAYVIYTSGSTGRPKGVLIPHRALAAHCWSMTQVYELRAEDRILQFSSFTFDASLEQILPTLLVGARLVLRGQEVWSPAQLLKQIDDGRLTIINLPPAYWHQVAQEWMNEPESLLTNHLRLVIVGGDRLLPEHLHLWRQTAMRSVRLLNAYGPTETTITATLYDTAGYTGGNTSSESVPIGRPLPNRRIYILDRSGTPVPIGVPGELHIGGDLLARGYLHRPELTAERFIADPFSNDPQARLYKTGDLARYLADGTIEFLGRVDQQVKIRGFRIELGEIEEVLSQHPTVHEAVVVAREDTPGDKYLAAYVVARQIESQALRSYLQQKLPNYMLPAAFVFLERLPLLSTGKIDRRALPAPKLTRLQEEETFVAPRLLIHQQLVQIWEELLDVRPIGIRDNFFHLGGHSLLAARLVDRIEHVFGKRIALSTLFSGPTIEQLAEALQHQEKPDVRTSVFPVQVGGSKRPFFFLHGDWTGGAFYCFALARALGPDQPFYVLEPYKFSGLQSPPSFEAVAAAHIESLRAIQPEGPYLLGGFCNGGLLAYEMARQLQVAGERVDFLALINPSVPVQFKTMRAISKRISKLQRLGVNTQTHLFLRMRHALRHIYRTLYPSSSRVQDFYKLLAIDPRLEGMFPPVEALYNDYVGVFTWLVSRYETGIYPGKITFFWASEEPFIEKTWLPVTKAKDSEDIENHSVPGTHMSCVTEHIQDLAECLSTCASRIQEEALNQK